MSNQQLVLIGNKVKFATGDHFAHDRQISRLHKKLQHSWDSACFRVPEVNQLRPSCNSPAREAQDHAFGKPASKG